MIGKSDSQEHSSQPPPSPPPPRGPRLGLFIIVVLVAAVAILAGYFWGRSASGGKKQAATAMPGHQHGSMAMPAMPAGAGPEIVINPIITQDIGVRVAPVTEGPLTRDIRTVGMVDYAEPLVGDVNLKVGGWIEKLYVDSLGQPVEKDQPLLDIYSPELYTAQEEYLQAYKAGKTTGSPGGESWDKGLLESARKRLEYFDISPQQIEELERIGKSSKTMALRSPLKGLVIAKNVFQGMKVDPGMQLFRIADLSTVWVMVTLYEYQIPYVQVGQKAIMSLTYVPGQTFEGKVTYVYPYLNQELRQVKVRLEFPNPDLLLKPGMFANVEIQSTLAHGRLLVPREAVLDTGERQVAFVSLGEGRFLPRNVKLGVDAEGGMVEVLEGLKAGDIVVVSGQFLLDSEANIREALAKMVPGALAATQPQQAVLAGPTELTTLPAPLSEALVKILNDYFAVGAALADDRMEGIGPSAADLARQAAGLVQVEIPDHPHFWHVHMEVADMGAKARQLAEAKDLGEARQNFADMGHALAKLLLATGVPPAFGKEVQELHCPMFRENQGGDIWLQPAGPVRNPYFGKAMPECFDKRTSLPVTGQRPAATATTAPAMEPASPASQEKRGMPPMPGM